jgi:nucleoid DNA-binding protein
MYIPLTLSRIAPQLAPGNTVMLIGFGVGYSWGACVLDWNEVEVPSKLIPRFKCGNEIGREKSK